MSAVPKPVLGKCRCPVCKTPDQVMKQSDKGRPYLMCDECDVQIFARSKRSGDAMLALLDKPATPAAPPAAQPAPKKETPREEAKPAVAAKPVQQQPEPRRGFLGRRA